MNTHTLELIAAIGGTLLTLLGGPPAVRRIGRWWAAYREKRAEARERIELAKLKAEEAKLEAEKQRDAHDERTEAKLWERLDRIEARADECDERAERCEEARAVDKADCDRRIAALDARTSDLTGRFRTIARHEIRKSTELPAVKDPK